jgi:putative hemolysin
MKVDVKNLMASKNPRLARVKPLVGYLRRAIHEDEVNRILEAHADKPAVEFIRATLEDMGIGYEVVGLDKLDPAGRYIFASNHPFGGLDGLMLAEKVAERFGDVRVVVNDLLMNLAPLRPIFIPVNTLGRQNADYAKQYNDTFAGNLPILTFPAGKCSRRAGRVICDPEWKGSFIKQAVATQRDVVPVFVEGRLSNFFYSLANLRKWLGVKANIEMLYLPDEMFRQRGSHFRITVGQPIPWQEFDDGEPPRIHAQQVKDIAYGLSESGK